MCYFDWCFKGGTLYLEWKRRYTIWNRAQKHGGHNIGHKSTFGRSFVIFCFCGISNLHLYRKNYHFVKLYIGVARIAYFCPKRVLIANTRVLRRLNGVSDWYCVRCVICNLRNGGILRVGNGVVGVIALFGKSYLPFKYGNAPCFFSNAPCIFQNASHIHINCEPHLKKCKAHFWIFHAELLQRGKEIGQWRCGCEL